MRLLKLSCALALIAPLAACILDPISWAVAASNSAAQAAATPESMNAAPADYRSYDCSGLQHFLPAMEDGLRKENDSFGRQVWNWHISSIKQIQQEKNCLGTSPNGTNTPVAGNAGRSAAAASPRGRLGVSINEVSTPVAQALGLASTAGALIVEASNSGTTGKSLLKPLDIIVEVSELPVNSPADLVAIVSKMRPGFNVALRVWRDRAMIDVNRVVLAPADSAPENAAAAKPTAAVPQAQPADTARRYCFSLILNDKVLGGAIATVWERDSNAASLEPAMTEFIEYMQKREPTIWPQARFPNPECDRQTAHCQALLKQSDITYFAVQGCRATRGEADNWIQQFTKGSNKYRRIEWKPGM